MLTTNPHQLDRLVGLAMLIIASTVFAYYTVWTLLMVRTVLPPLSLSLNKNRPDSTTNQGNPNQAHQANTPSSKTALRRRLSPHPIPLPAPRLGHPHPGHPPSPRRRGGRKLLERGDG
jgi:hypothetical protein